MISQAERNQRPALRTMLPKRFAVLAAADFRCTYCGQDLLASMDSLYGASMDHVQPKAGGGDDQADNLVAACRTCNTLKGCAEVASIEDARHLIRQRRAEFFAGFIGRANQAGVQLPRLEQLAGYATEISAAIAACARQAEDAADRLRIIQQNAAAIAAVMDRLAASPAKDRPCE